jgi:hypothetical protein
MAAAMQLNALMSNMFATVSALLFRCDLSGILVSPEQARWCWGI